MARVLPAKPAVLAHLEPIGRLLLVLRRAVVAPFALQTRQRHDVSHIACRGQRSGVRGQTNLVPGLRPQTSDLYSMISVTVPAPTVRPPSRMAKRNPFSSATGAISSPVIVVLSPGITISTPSGRFRVPVTSVTLM